MIAPRFLGKLREGNDPGRRPTFFFRHMIMRELAPSFSIPYPLAYQPEDPPFVPTAFGTRMELRCVIAVIRHGDRTPKQKMKMAVLHPL